MRAQSRAAKWISMSVLAGIVGFVGAVGSATAEPPGVSVVVRGRGDEALADVRVIRRNADGKWTTVGKTDASGQLTLPAEALDESWIIAAWINGTEPGEYRSPTGVKVQSSRVEVRLECGVRLTTEIVDAETGAAIPGAESRIKLWNVGFTPWSKSGEERFALVGPDGHGASLEIRLAPAVAASYWLAFGSAGATSSFVAGVAELSDGSALARRIVVPVRRAVTLRLDVRDPAGRLAVPAFADWMSDTGSYEPESTDTLAAWRPDAVLLRVPFYRGGRVWVVATHEGLTGRELVTLPKEIGVRPEPVRVRLAPLPPDSRPRGALIGIGGTPTYRKAEPGGAILRVQALRTDGTPARGRTIRIRSDATVSEPLHPDLPPTDRPVNDFVSRTNEDGQLGIRDLPLGGYTVTAEDDRYIAVTQRVTLSGKGTPTRVELREPKGATVDVAVVDGSGKPLPFAKVYVTGPAGVPGDAGVEPRRMDPYTDAVGRRTFTRVDPGVIRVRAVWWSREVTATVEVPDGGKGSVTVAFDPPKAK